MHADPRIAVRGFEMIIVTGSRLSQVFMRAGGSVELVESAHSHFSLWVGCVRDSLRFFGTFLPNRGKERYTY